MYCKPSRKYKRWQTLMRRSGGGGKNVVFRRCLDQHCPKKLFLPQPQGFVMSLLPPSPHQTKLNSHKNLCKAVNLDQIGFDLSANEISAPDRRFVIDSVLDRGDPWSCRIWSENNGLWVPKHDQLQMWQIASHDLGLSWPRTPCLAWIYRSKKPFCGRDRSNISNFIQM